MPASEFERWRNYADEEPFGQPWDNWLMAMPAYMFASANTGKGKQPPKFDAFFYKGKSDREQAEDARVEGFISMLEGKGGQ